MTIIGNNKVFEKSLSRGNQAEIWIDTNGKIIEINGSMVRLSGYSANIVQRKLVSDILLFSQDKFWDEILKKIRYFNKLVIKSFILHRARYIIPATLNLKLDDRKDVISITVSNSNAHQLEQDSYPIENTTPDHDFDEIITNSPKYQKVLKQIQEVAPTNASVLILGETGTGKELLAKSVHQLSKRSKRKLIKINCANLSADLIESELFGHEKGAFTGAYRKKVGKFELAHKGTLFLDEIGELPLELQSKLLRVLQSGELYRLGSNETTTVDIRIIAATNRNLARLVNEGKFRSDLYYNSPC
ncbi:MAG: sigma-54 factor interaction domain-containing protein [Bacteroidota bacterium]